MRHPLRFQRQERIQLWCIRLWKENVKKPGVAKAFSISTDKNDPPTAKVLPNQTMVRNQNKKVNLENYFSDPNGDSLTYTVFLQHDSKVATANVEGDN